MAGRWAMVPAALLLAAAAQGPVPTAASPLPAPPATIGSRMAGGDEPAPVPDPDLLPPTAEGTSGVSLSPKLYMPRNRFDGDGFLPGSTSQGNYERNMRPTPGLNLNVPLQ